MKDIKENWQKEIIDSELKFWDEWFRTKGLDWPEDYLFRTDPNTELQEYLREILNSNNDIKEDKDFNAVGMKIILDVGSGPLTVLGKNMDGKPLNIVCCDPLALEYFELIKKYFENPPIDFVLHGCDSEKLSSFFTTYGFDLVHAQNCIDHSYDPVKSVCEMIRVCNTGGTVFLKHEQNEADNEGHGGLHQWNFDCVDGKFVISGNDERTVMDDYLATIFDGIAMDTKLEEGYVVTRITRI